MPKASRLVLPSAPATVVSAPLAGLRSTATWTRAAVVAVASFLFGGLTFLLQGLLPDALASFANSASGWTLVTVLLLTAARLQPATAALLGATSFVLLTLGYSAAAELGGLYYDPTLFALVGLVAGPAVGVAASWLRSAHPWQAAVSTALLAGIGLGEATFGLTTVADTTSPVYWSLIAVASLALLGAMLVRRVRGAPWATCAVVGTAVTAVAFVVAYESLGGVYR